MKTYLKLFSLALPVVAIAVGCEVTEQQVSDARQNAAEERQQINEVRKDGAQAVAEEEHETAEARMKAYKPNLDAVAEEERETAEARKNAAENLAAQKKEAAEAENEADRLARELEMKKSRDAFVETVNAKLESADKKIDAMEETASKQQGAEQEATEKRVEQVTYQRTQLAKALDELQNEELKAWENWKVEVETQMELLDKELEKSNS